MATINVRNAHIAFITKGEGDEVVYGTPKRIPNLMKVDVTPVFAEAKNYGDGEISQTEHKLQGANIAAEYNRIPLEIVAEMYGRTMSAGEMIISTKDVPKSFAFGYEEEIGGGQIELCWYYECMAAPMGKSSQQATENMTFGSDTLNMTAKSRDKDGRIAKIADTTDPLFLDKATWFSDVETV